MPDGCPGLRETRTAIALVEANDHCAAPDVGSAFGADMFDAAVGLSGKLDDARRRSLAVDADRTHDLFSVLGADPNPALRRLRRCDLRLGLGCCGVVTAEGSRNEP